MVQLTRMFGPYYPPLLQVAMSHAERFVSLLWGAEMRGAATEASARAWVLGRREELETFVGCVVDDWAHGRVSEEAAEKAVSAYLRAVHAGARAALGLADILPCCLGDLEATVSSTETLDVETFRAPCAPEPAGDRTLVDPAAVLADLPPRSGR